jgi:hypothetical protein
VGIFFTLGPLFHLASAWNRSTLEDLSNPVHKGFEDIFQGHGEILRSDLKSAQQALEGRVINNFLTTRGVKF